MTKIGDQGWGVKGDEKVLRFTFNELIKVVISA
jgi:hypothetical protein